MFGLGKEKGGGDSEFIFDIEKEILEVERYKEIVATIEERTAYIKELMRKGEQKQSFDKLVIILQGYASTLKVLSRVISKQGKEK